MRKTKALSLFFCIGITAMVSAQSSIDSVLASVSKHNKTLAAKQQQIEAGKLEYKTGIYLSNPVIEYDYLYGSPVEAGNQTDFNIIQSFDFPAAYIQKRRIASMQVSQLDHEFTILRQDVLLQAKQLCIQLVHFNKWQHELGKRLKTAQAIYDNYRQRLEKGDASVLDANKAKLQLLNIQTDIQLNKSAINQTIQKLTQLNGGIPVTFTDTHYPSLPQIPDFKTLESTIEANDPSLKYYQAEKDIFSGQVQLSRSLSFPKFETGYHQQAILGQKFHGAHIGVTIPLWERKNTVKYQKAQELFGDFQIQEHRNEHYHTIQQLYEKYQNLQISLNEYKKVMGELKSDELLGKSLALGHISFIEYSLEISYYYESNNKYLLLEKDFFETVSELYKFTL